MFKADTAQLEPILQQASIELERRLRAGTPGGAEEVLADFPELAIRSETALEVIYTEFVIRQELGQAPTLPELQQRFPQWHKDLTQLFEVHAAVDVPKLSQARRGTRLVAILPWSSWKKSNAAAWVSFTRRGRRTSIGWWPSR